MKIKILNWERFNEKRKDVKHHTWWRCQISMPTNPDLFALTPSEKWVWVCLLSHAAEKQREELEIDTAWFAWYSQTDEKTVLNAIAKLDGKSIQVVTEHVTNTLRERNEHDSLQTDRQTKNNAHSANVRALVTRDDIERAYKQYPRKVGKSRGLDIAIKQVKDPPTLHALETAIKNYAAAVRRDGTEKKYIKHFSTFMGEWRDWIQPDEDASPAVEVNHAEMGYGL